MLVLITIFISAYGANGYLNTHPTYPCSTDWLYSPVSGKCYKYYEKKLSWDDAAIKCSSIDMNGAMLAKVETNFDLHALHTIFNLNGNFEDQWVGGRKYSGAYLWQDNTTVSDSTVNNVVWNSQMIGYGDCIVYSVDSSMIKMWTTTGYIHYGNCTDLHGYFCEHRAKDCSGYINSTYIIGFNNATMQLVPSLPSVANVIYVACRYGYFRLSQVLSSGVTVPSTLPDELPANTINCTGIADAQHNPANYLTSLNTSGTQTEECREERCDMFTFEIPFVTNAASFTTGVQPYYRVTRSLSANCNVGYVNWSNSSSTVSQMLCSSNPLTPGVGIWSPTDFNPCVPVRCDLQQMFQIPPSNAQLVSARQMITGQSFNSYQQSMFNTYKFIVTIKCNSGKFFQDRSASKYVICNLTSNSLTETEWQGYQGTILFNNTINIPCVDTTCKAQDVSFTNSNGSPKSNLNLQPVFTVIQNNIAINYTVQSGNDYPFGTVIRFYCLNGTVTVTQSTFMELLCNTDGVWDPPMSVCIGIGTNTSSLTGSGKHYIPPAQEASSADSIGTMTIAILVIFFLFVIAIDLVTLSRDYKLLVENIRNLRRFVNAKRHNKMV